MLRAEFLKLRAEGYDNLAERLAGKQERSDVMALSGATYHVELEGFWDDKEHRDCGSSPLSTMAGSAPSFPLPTRSRSARPGRSRSTRPSDEAFAERVCARPRRGVSAFV